MEQQNEYMVCVKCMTYNHAPYITDAMNGFTMQETTFPYVCVIVDDASTDEEQDVITKYLQDNFDLEDKSTIRHEETDNYVLTFAQHKTNKNCYFAVLFLKYNHYSIRKTKAPYIAEWTEHAKYIALCEGDDYWIDPSKLQMQVDFLENNTDYVLCHTDYEATKKRHSHYKEHYKDGNYFPNMFHKGFMIGTLTAIFRMDAYLTTPKYYINKNWQMGDKPLWYELAYLGKVKYIPKITAIYRVLNNSASHKIDIHKQFQFKNNGLEITRFYAKKYGVRLLENGYTTSYYTSLLMYCFHFEKKDISKRIMKEACQKKMLSFKGISYYLATNYRPIGFIVNILSNNL